MTMLPHDDAIEVLPYDPPESGACEIDGECRHVLACYHVEDIGPIHVFLQGDEDKEDGERPESYTAMLMLPPGTYPAPSCTEGVCTCGVLRPEQVLSDEEMLSYEQQEQEENDVIRHPKKKRKYSWFHGEDVVALPVSSRVEDKSAEKHRKFIVRVIVIVTVAILLISFILVVVMLKMSNHIDTLGELADDTESRAQREP
ncbi:uncharacterized protein LOC106154334 [Lingula anatina]|uniref:Uncharacterized protein LOC106154334 n=1 Tax=Lingula anatina TaxID=7574 RepID=A0A1S3HDJ7_LINAN|nr:uncharacterized protein LOC106154334 [Lingula anatina]|eukprot:XP_013384108.1 uncharacterized protein LOC106154334 [Lingula anatina]